MFTVKRARMNPMTTRTRTPVRPATDIEIRRRKLGWTKSALAEHAGVSARYVGLLEDPTPDPRLERVRAALMEGERDTLDLGADRVRGPIPRI